MIAIEPCECYVNIINAEVILLMNESMTKKTLKERKKRKIKFINQKQQKKKS